MSSPAPPTFKFPIDDLIEHLKSNKPYGLHEALLLWEALKRLSDSAQMTSNILVDSGLTGSPTPVVPVPGSSSESSMARTFMLMGG